MKTARKLPLFECYWVSIHMHPVRNIESGYLRLKQASYSLIAWFIEPIASRDKSGKEKDDHLHAIVWADSARAIRSEFRSQMLGKHALDIKPVTGWAEYAERASTIDLRHSFRKLLAYVNYLDGHAEKARSERLYAVRAWGAATLTAVLPSQRRLALPSQRERPKPCRVCGDPSLSGRERTCQPCQKRAARKRQKRHRDRTRNA